ncbi:MAG: type II secretion system F family protein [Vicingaceae bacterium]
MAISMDDIRTKPHTNGDASWNIGQWLQYDFTKPRGLKLRDKLTFYEELHLLLTSGLDLENAIDLLLAQGKEKSKLTVIIRGLKKDIINGKSLSDAMSDSGVFTDYEHFSIKIGEETGNTVEVLEEIRNYYEQLSDQRKKLSSALSYPAVVFSVAIGAVFFLLNFVVPLFEDVFKRFNGELPLITQLVIHLSDKLKTWLPITLLLFTVGGSLIYFRRKNARSRQLLSLMVMRMPIIGRIVQKIYLARLFSALHLLVKSKNPLNTSLGMVQKMIGFYPLEQALLDIEDQVIKGKSLSSCISRHPMFDARTVTLIKVAEEVGQLEHVLGKIAKGLSADVSNKLNGLGSLLEPILIIGVGSMVAFILIAMYLPLFQLSTSVY